MCIVRDQAVMILVMKEIVVSFMWHILSCFALHLISSLEIIAARVNQFFQCIQLQHTTTEELKWINNVSDKNDWYICNVAFSMIMISHSSLYFTLLQNESSYKFFTFRRASTHLNASTLTCLMRMANRVPWEEVMIEKREGVRDWHTNHMNVQKLMPNSKTTFWHLTAKDVLNSLGYEHSETSLTVTW